MKSNNTTPNKQQTPLVHHFLEKSAKKFPDNVALIHEETRATYQLINNYANKMATWLMDHGIFQGDRVAILMENGLEYVIEYYAILKAGGIAVPLSTGLRAEGLRQIVKEITPRYIFTSGKFEKILKAANLSKEHCSGFIIHSFKKILEINGIQIFQLEDIVRRSQESNPELSIDPNRLASIIYTSGSTGKPKGAMLSHGNIVANAQSICSYLSLIPDDIQMVVLPFFYVMGKSLLNTHFAVGATIVINNKFAYPASVLNQMVAEQVTGFSGVPSTYAFLLHQSPLKAYRDKLKSLRYCSQAGGHMPRLIKTKLRNALPDHTDIFIMYGASEASARLTYLNPNYFELKMGSIGKAIPAVTLKLVGTSGEKVAPGEKGEIVASGPNIMQGYWKDKAATAKVFNNGWYHTGDIAYQDSDGFYYVTGRKDNLIKTGGHRINPQEVEDVIMDTGLVVETAVVGIPDNLLGSKLAAVVEPKEKGIAGEEIIQKCAKGLPKYKLPSQIIFVRALPKQKSGKIDYEKCLDLSLSKKQTINEGVTCESTIS